MIIHKNFAQQSNARLAYGAIHFDFIEIINAQSQHLQRRTRVDDKLLRRIADFVHQQRHPMIIHFLGITLMNFVRFRGSINGFDAVHDPDTPKHMQFEVGIRFKARVHVLGIFTRSNNWNVVVTGFVQSLAGERRVLYGAAVFAVFGQPDRNIGMLHVGVLLEPEKIFADIDLCRKTNIIVNVFLAKLNGSLVRQRQGFCYKTYGLTVFRYQHTECMRKVWHKNLSLRFVFFGVLDGEKFLFPDAVLMTIWTAPFLM